MKYFALLGIVLFSGCSAVKPRTEFSSFKVPNGKARRVPSSAVRSFRLLGGLSTESTHVSSYSSDNLALAASLESGLGDALEAKFKEMDFALPLAVETIAKAENKFLLKVRLNMGNQWETLDGFLAEKKRSIAQVGDFGASVILCHIGKDYQNFCATYEDPGVLTYDVSLNSELMAKQFLEAAKMEGGISCPVRLASLNFHVDEKVKYIWVGSDIQIDFSGCQLKVSN